MMVEITPSIVFGALGACATLCVGAFALGNLQWYRRSEGTSLEKTVEVLAKALDSVAKALEGVTDLRHEVRGGLERVHERIDENSKEIAHLTGVCSQAKKDH
jgi:chromosome segregation ATPase